MLIGSVALRGPRRLYTSFIFQCRADLAKVMTKLRPQQQRPLQCLRVMAVCGSLPLLVFLVVAYLLGVLHWPVDWEARVAKGVAWGRGAGGAGGDAGYIPVTVYLIHEMDMSIWPLTHGLFIAVGAAATSHPPT